LRKLESKYADSLVVIGVHSGKYHAERVTARIRDASIRLDAIHPVVNDRQFRIWRSYAVSAWPTLAVVDPFGYVVGMHAGEFTAEMLEPFIEKQIERARAKGGSSASLAHFAPDTPTIEPGILSYPGKVAIDGDRIAISDSGHNRVLAGTLAGDGKTISVTSITGSGRKGFMDGAPGEFDSPQGLAFAGPELFVADAGNHAVRAIDLSTGVTRTLVGTGKLLRTRADRDMGAMASPWDLTVVEGTLFVGMAGRHQIWRVDPATGRASVHAGTGGEDIRDGPVTEALLAQPMGITAIGSRLYFADSESNAVRWCDTSPAGETGTIVGTGLFDFGDVDGEGDDVRLQHPQAGVPHAENQLLVADSYNDCIKLIDIDRRRSTVWLRGFHEPGGLARTDSSLYVADTNAHRVAVVNLETREVADLRIELP
jgi:DNA-binding beta-propeller fold protein YncE